MAKVAPRVISSNLYLEADIDCFSLAETSTYLDHGPRVRLSRQLPEYLSQPKSPFLGKDNTPRYLAVRVPRKTREKTILR